MKKINEINLPAKTRVAKKYDKVADKLRKRILAAAYPGILPGTKVIADEFDVSLMTANKAIKTLEREGLVTRLPRKGTVINPLKPNVAKRIALVVRDVSLPLTSRVVAQFERMARHSKFQLLFFQHGDSRRQEIAIAKELAKEKLVDGIILVQVSENEDGSAAEILHKAGITVVELGLAPSVPNVSAYHSLRFDEFDGFKAGTHFLTQKGHRNIAMVYPTFVANSDFNHCPRWQGYAHSMQLAGQQPLPPVWFDSADPFDPVKLKTFLHQIAGFSALFIHHDSLAATILPILYRSGVHIPNQKSIISFDGAPTSASLDLTTLSLPMEEAALEAAKIIASAKMNPPTPFIRKVFKTELVVRGSVADFTPPE